MSFFPRQFHHVANSERTKLTVFLPQSAHLPHQRGLKVVAYRLKRVKILPEDSWDTVWPRLKNSLLPYCRFGLAWLTRPNAASRQNFKLFSSSQSLKNHITMCFFSKDSSVSPLFTRNFLNKFFKQTSLAFFFRFSQRFGASFSTFLRPPRWFHRRPAFPPPSAASPPRGRPPGGRNNATPGRRGLAGGQPDGDLTKTTGPFVVGFCQTQKASTFKPVNKKNKKIIGSPRNVTK